MAVRVQSPLFAPISTMCFGAKPSPLITEKKRSQPYARLDVGTNSYPSRLNVVRINPVISRFTNCLRPDIQRSSSHDDATFSARVEYMISDYATPLSVLTVCPYPKRQFQSIVCSLPESRPFAEFSEASTVN